MNKKITYVRQTFNDFEQLKEAASKWSLDFIQLDAGKFEGEMMLLDMNQLQLVAARFNRHFMQKGITPAGYRTFAIPADQHQSFTWRGYDISENNLMIFPKSGEIDANTYPGFNIFTISLAEEVIDNFRESHHEAKLNILTNDVEVIELSPTAMNVLRQRLSYIISQVQTHPERIEKKAFRRIITGEVPEALLNNLITHKPTLRKPNKRIRDISLKKAIDYLNACDHELPTVIELCLISGASQRTLEYAFKEMYGVSPKEYMIKQRLNLVHQALLKANPNQLFIKDIAHQFGFWHLGQFATDYKKMFHKLPSNTFSSGYLK